MLAIKVWAGLVALTWGGAVSATCVVANDEILLKDSLRQGNDASYGALVAKHRLQIANCRRDNPIKIQALWLKSADLKLEAIADQAVNQGYNALIVDATNDFLVNGLVPLAQQRGMALYGVINLANENLHQIVKLLEQQQLAGLLLQVSQVNTNGADLLNRLPQELRPLMRLYLQEGRVTPAMITRVAPPQFNRPKSLELTARLTEKMLSELLVKNFENNTLRDINRAIAGGASQLPMGILYPMGLKFIPAQVANAIYPILCEQCRLQELHTLVTANPARLVCPVLTSRQAEMVTIADGISCVVHREF